MLEGMEALWDVVGDARRREILELLRERPHSVSELTDALGLSQPGVSKHLKVLRDAGLVISVPDGQRREYRLTAAPLRELERWVDPFRAHWAQALDDLERGLDEHAARAESAGAARRRAESPRKDTQT